MDERELRDMLNEKAREADTPARMPRSLLRRARRRRVGTVLLTALVSGGLAFGGFVGVRAAVEAARDEEPRIDVGGGSNGMESWRGIWPQATREEGEQAQERAALNDRDFTWQLADHLVVERYGLEVLQWDEVYLEEDPGLSDPVTGGVVFHIGTCRSIRRGEPCPQEALVTVEQLLPGQEPYRIWFVTEASPTASPSPAEEPPSTVGAVSCKDRQGGDDTYFPDFIDVEFESYPDSEWVIFRFEPQADVDGTTPVSPAYWISFTDQLVTDGEGAPVDVEGEAFLAVSFMARGVDLSGEEVTPIYTGPREIGPDLLVVKELEMTGDFEGVVSWGIGLGDRRCFMVEAGPTSLAVVFPTKALPFEPGGSPGP